MASILDISKSTYVKYERGEREPKFEVLFKLSRLFSVSIDYLLGASDEETPHIHSAHEAVTCIANQKFLETLGKYEDAVSHMVGDNAVERTYYFSDEILKYKHVAKIIDIHADKMDNHTKT